MKDKRTYEERREYLIRAVAKRRKQIRLKAIEHLGGKCMHCGYSKYPEVLEFHHKNPKEKDFNLSAKGHCRSWERVMEEIKKCLLLCANCHRELHVKQRLAASEGNLRMNSE
jgi:5-methylcytosine-specific restriction endonuclease McrA